MAGHSLGKVDLIFYYNEALSCHSSVLELLCSFFRCLNIKGCLAAKVFNSGGTFFKVDKGRGCCQPCFRRKSLVIYTEFSYHKLK